MEVGVCSWSIDRHDMLRSIRLAGTEIGLRLVQIGFFTEEAVRRADADRIRRTAEDSGITLTSSFIAFEGEDYSSMTSIAETGGYALDEAYPHRRAITAEVADLSAAIGCGAVAVHVGTIPEDPDSLEQTAVSCSAPPFHPPLARGERGGSARHAKTENALVHRKLVVRVGEVADLLAERKLRLHLETGREPADVLRAFIDAVGRPNVGVNFDAGNFVVYGTDVPARAVSRLKGLIENVHLKDALRSARPGTEYGQPAHLGAGDADIPGVIGSLRSSGYRGPVLVECGSRHAGVDAVRSAVAYLHRLLP